MATRELRKSPEEIEKERHIFETARVLQCFVRMKMAQIKVKIRAQRCWRRVFDPQFKMYFWYNLINGQSQWHVPKYQQLYSDRDEEGCKGFQKIVRGFVGRRRAKHKANAKWTRFFDAKLNKFYWMTNDDGKEDHDDSKEDHHPISAWSPSRIFGRLYSTDGFRPSTYPIRVR